MEKSEWVNQPDNALLPFLSCVTERDLGDALEDLLDKQIQPTIEKTLRAKLHTSLKASDFSQANQDALELVSETKLLLISELGKLKLNPNGKVIHNLNNYVISVTINAYRQYLRAKYPLRRQLKNKLQYLLTHHPKFILREDERGNWVCSLRQNKQSIEIQPPSAESIRAGISETVNQENLSESEQTINLLIAVFEFAKVPIAFNDLLLIVAETQGIKDQKQTSELDDNQPEQNKFTGLDDKIISEIEQQEQIRKVWTEICEMPVRHRLALLLNLKDRQGDCVVRLFPILRIASIRQIAETLDFSADDFAAIWNELPWEDLKIAEYMNLTRQQVINLRQSARARLVRQLKNF